MKFSFKKSLVSVKYNNNLLEIKHQPQVRMGLAAGASCEMKCSWKWCTNCEGLVFVMHGDSLLNCVSHQREQLGTAREVGHRQKRSEPLGRAPQ